MKKHLLIVACIIVNLACHRAGNDGSYRNFDKWQIYSAMADRPFRGHPRWVTEYSLAPVDSANPKKKHMFYFKYGFDDSGDLISRGCYMDDKLSYETDMRYDADGRQDVSWVSAGRDTTRSVSRSMGEGRFINIYRGITGKPGSTWIISFPAGVNEEMQEKYNDTTATGKPVATLHFYYDGGRIIRKTSVSKDGQVEQRFFYSKWDSPDSIQTYNDAKLVEREIFYNNAQGDPDRYYVIHGKDTVNRRSWQYIYDMHGNWTRKVETTAGADTLVSPLGPARTIDEREFVY